MNINIVIFLFTITTAGIFYSLPIPLYPDLALSKGYSDSYIGVIFAFYSVANLILIPFISHLIVKYGRFNLLIISLLAKVR